MNEKELEQQLKQRQCKECVYYDSRGGQKGHCRKRPPRVTSVVKQQPGVTGDSIVDTTAWPTVKDEDWCGEFEFAAGKGPMKRF